MVCVKVCLLLIPLVTLASARPTAENDARAVDKTDSNREGRFIIPIYTAGAHHNNNNAVRSGISTPTSTVPFSFFNPFTWFAVPVQPKLPNVEDSSSRNFVTNNIPLPQIFTQDMLNDVIQIKLLQWDTDNDAWHKIVNGAFNPNARRSQAQYFVPPQQYYFPLYQNTMPVNGYYRGPTPVIRQAKTLTPVAEEEKEFPADSNTSH